MTFFEAPHRITNTLLTVASILGDRPICIARELTKVHQQFLRGTASEIATQLQSTPKGEFTVVIGPLTKIYGPSTQRSDEAIAVEFGLITESGGMTRREAVTATAKRLGLPSRDVYAAIERVKHR